MKINNLKVGVRLGGTIAAILILMSGMLGVGLIELSTISVANEVMLSASQKKELAEEWLQGISSNGVRTIARAKNRDPEVDLYFDKEIKAVSARLSDIQKQMTASAEGDDRTRLLDHVAAKRKLYATTRDAAFAIKFKGVEADPELRTFVTSELLPAMKAYIDAVKDVAMFEKAMYIKADETIGTTIERARRTLLIIGFIALVLSAALGLALSRSITQPLHQALVAAQRVAAGDLTGAVDGGTRDELGTLLSALKMMSDRLLKTVQEVRSGTETIVTASREIADGNHDLSARTEQQAGALEETASSIEELSSTVKQNAENARQANILAEKATGVAMRGGDVVAQVVETMASINESSARIVDIISVIDGIAFQTNILALNAAVEAARAGEQGRGFAVVASEVRNLAQRSASAAKEIKLLIADSVDRVATGERLVENAGSTMRDIVDAIKQVNGMVSEIAAAGLEQTAGIEQINAAIIQIDDVTQQNAALVEEAAAAATCLDEQARALEQTVSVFHIGRQAAGAAAPIAPGASAIGKSRPSHGRARSGANPQLNWTARGG